MTIFILLTLFVIAILVYATTRPNAFRIERYPNTARKSLSN